MTGETRFLAELFSSWHSTILRASAELESEEFFGNESVQMSMFWTMMHLTGLMEWVCYTITGIPTSAPVALLDKFKGELEGEEPTVTDVAIPRQDVISLFESAGRRMERVFLQVNGSRLDQEISESTTAKVFPTVGSLLSAVASQGFFHLGQLSLSTPTLVMRPSLTLPTMFKDGNLEEE